MGALNRRAFLHVAALAATFAAACAPTTGPAVTPVNSDAEREVTPTAPSQVASAATPTPEVASPPAHAATSPPPTPAPAWRQEWEGVITAARAEGKLSLLTWGDTWGGVGYRRVVDRFQQAFPGVAVDRLSEFLGQRLVEQGAARTPGGRLRVRPGPRPA